MVCFVEKKSDVSNCERNRILVGSNDEDIESIIREGYYRGFTSVFIILTATPKGITSTVNMPVASWE